MIYAVQKFLRKCPYTDGCEININYLSPEPRSFAVDAVAAEPIVRRYADGGAVKQFCFAIACRDAYDADADGNAETAELMEKTAEWIEEQDKNGNYPDIADIPVGMEVTELPALENTAGYSARTSMKVRLLYRCEG